MYAAMLCYYGPNCFALASRMVLRSGNAATTLVVATVAVQAALLGLLLALWGGLSPWAG